MRYKYEIELYPRKKVDGCHKTIIAIMKSYGEFEDLGEEGRLLTRTDRRVILYRTDRTGVEECFDALNQMPGVTITKLEPALV